MSLANSRPHDAKGVSNYTVLARRYRPQQFEDCIGQEHVAQVLKKAIETNRVAHAYLFTGARGVGKTSMARILAKALNCVQGPTARPCGECDICQSIASGDDVDVLEIDGASNRGIDEVRELRQGVGFRPSRSRYRIYIIDEVHMLTKEAFNALLKTLEEPPAHVKFIFATTEPQKIPITILSRCQRFDFLGVELGKIKERLKAIVESEGAEADDDALDVVARRAGGSMRDSQSLLDQLLAFGADRLTAENVHRILGTANEQRLLAALNAIFAGNVADCLNEVKLAVSEGVQLGEWVEQLIEVFRDLLVLHFDANAELASMPNRMRGELLTWARQSKAERTMEMMDLLSVCRMRMKAAAFSRALLEMTLVRLCRLDEFLNLDVLASNAGETGVNKSIPNSFRPAVGVVNIASRPAGSTSYAGAQPTVALAKPASAVAPPPSPESVAEPSQPTPTNRISPAEDLEGFWAALLQGIDDLVLSQMLLKGTPSFQPPATLLVGFPVESSICRSFCEESGRIGRLEAAAAKIAGSNIKIKIETKSEAAAPAGGQAGPATPEKTAAATPTISTKAAAAHPLVARAEKVLGARILQCDRVAPLSGKRAGTMEPTPEDSSAIPHDDLETHDE